MEVFRKLIENPYDTLTLAGFAAATLYATTIVALELYPRFRKWMKGREELREELREYDDLADVVRSLEDGSFEQEFYGQLRGK